MDKQLTFNEPAFEITKSYRDDSGQMYIEGVASTTSIDLTKERMSPEVIAKMAARLIGKPLRSEHGKGWDDKLGEIIKADVVDDNGAPALWIKARLYDWSSKAKDLFKFLSTGAKMGLSVAGKIGPGGLVKELVESVGKYIPTYKDVEPTEVSVTDHPANLDTWAVAVSKSLNLDNYNPDEFAEKNDETDKMKEAADQPADFLDPINKKFPVDQKHVIPALRFFNKDNCREEQGYEDTAWETMGKKLASKISQITGETYMYDTSTQKVVKAESHVEKEVSIEMNDKGNLISKTIPQDIKNLAKEWGKDIDAEVAKSKEAETTVEKVEEVKTDAVAKGSSSSSDSSTSSGSGSDSSSGSDKGSFSIPTLGASSSSDSSSTDSSSGSSDSSGSTDTSSGSSTGFSSELSSLLDDLKSTLESLAESVSGSSSSSTDSSSGSGSSSSDSSSGSSTSSGSDKTSTDKAMDSASTTTVVDDKTSTDKDAGSASPASSSDTTETSEVARAIDSLVLAANTMKEALAKKAKSSKSSANGSDSKSVGAKPKLDVPSGAASDSSSSDNVSASSTAKAMEGILSTMQEMQKSIAKRDEEFAKLVEKQNEAPQNRRGYALALEKNFTGHVDVGNQDADPVLLKKLASDSEIDFATYHKYKTMGIIPEKYKA